MNAICTITMNIKHRPIENVVYETITVNDGKGNVIKEYENHYITADKSSAIKAALQLSEQSKKNAVDYFSDLFLPGVIHSDQIR